MIINIVEVKNLQEIDFQSLFEGSFPDIDTNYYIKDPEKGYNEAKRDSYLRNLESIFNNEKTPANQEVLAFKATIDEVDHLVNVGFIDKATGTFTGVWMLSKRYQNTRNFIYSPEYIQARKRFLNEKGIEYYCLKTVKNSLMYKSLKRSHNLGTINIKQEVETYVLDIVVVDLTFSL